MTVTPVSSPSFRDAASPTMPALAPAVPTANLSTVTARIAAIQQGFSASFAAASAALATPAASMAPTLPSATVAAGAQPAGAQGMAALGRAALQGTVASGSTTSSPTADAVVAKARQFLGVPYVWGASSPTAVDCSGLMVQVFKSVGITIPRVSHEQATAGVAVSRDDLRPGDMVFFDYSSSRAGVDHVALYIGDGKVIEAPRPGEDVKVADLDWSHYVTARRVLPDTADASPTTPADVATGHTGQPALNVAGLPAAAKPYVPQLEQAATAAGIDPNLLASVVWSESAFNPSARSGAGAIGLGQLMPSTAASLGVNPYDPASNLRGTATYLAEQLGRFGSRDLAVAAYNAGPGAVDRYDGVPPYPETRAYVHTVLARLSTLEGPA